MKLKSGWFTKCVSVFSVSVLILGIFLTMFSVLNSPTSYAQTVTNKFKTNLDRYSYETMTSIDEKKVEKIDHNIMLEKQADLFGVTKDNIELVNISKVKDTKTADLYYVNQYTINSNKNDSITVVYSNSGKVLSIETIVFSDNNKAIEKFSDGVLVFRAEKDNKGNFTSMYNILNGKKQYYSNKDLKSISKWYKCMNSTLSGLGVPSWVIGVVGVGCAAVCAVTIGTGCWACLGVAGIGYGTEIVYALNHCKSKW